MQTLLKVVTFKHVPKVVKGTHKRKMAKSKNPKEHKSLAEENAESQNMLYIIKLANTYTVMDNETDKDKVKQT